MGRSLVKKRFVVKRELFPKLYALERNNDCVVFDRILNGENWCWYRDLSPWEVSLVTDLSNLVNNSERSVSSTSDSWVWCASGAPVITIKASYTTQMKLYVSTYSAKLMNMQVDWKKRVWINFLPLKINGFVWKLAWDRLPTLENLKRHNIIHSLTSGRCRFCSIADEMADHLFRSCLFTEEIWRRLTSWLKVTFLLVIFSYTDSYWGLVEFW